MALPGFRIAQSLTGTHPHIGAYAPAASQTFVRGDVVRWLQANTIKIAADDDAAALGVALDDAVDSAGTLRTEVRIAEFTGGTIFSADNSGTTLALGTHAGDTCSLDTTAMSVVVGTAGAAMFKIVGQDITDNDTAGTGYRVLVTVPAAKSQASGYGTAALDAT